MTANALPSSGVRVIKVLLGTNVSVALVSSIVSSCLMSELLISQLSGGSRLDHLTSSDAVSLTLGPLNAQVDAG